MNLSGIMTLSLDDTWPCQGKRPWMIHCLSRDKLVLAAVLPAFCFIVALIPYVMPKFCQLRLNILHYIATPIWNLLTSEYYVSYLLAMLTLLNVDCVVLLSSLLLRSKGNYILELLTFLRFSFREVTFLMRVVLHFRETYIWYLNNSLLINSIYRKYKPQK